jgi:hypothetical protein
MTFAAEGASGADARRRRLSAVAAWLFAGGLFASFFLSIILIDRIGLHGYAATGGSFLQKVHPGTWMLALAMAARLAAQPSPAKYLRRKLNAFPELLLYAIGLFAANVFGYLFTPYPASLMIDTFVPPAIILLLMTDLDAQAARRIAWAIVFFMTANAAIAIVEGAANIHLETFDLPPGVSADPSRLDMAFDWRAQLALERRATALLGHPLNNALLQSAFLMAMAAPGARWIPFGVRAVSILLSVLALAAFAGRTAIVLSAAYLSWRGAVFGFEALTGRRRLSAGLWLAIAAGLVLLLAGAALAFSLGAFDQTLSRFSSDSGSASARVAMFELFSPLSWTSIVFGPDPAQLATWVHIQGLAFGVGLGQHAQAHET